LHADADRIDAGPPECGGEPDARPVVISTGRAQQQTYLLALESDAPTDLLLSIGEYFARTQQRCERDQKQIRSRFGPGGKPRLKGVPHGLAPSRIELEKSCP
jgi:hypothetical protein